MLTTLNLTFFGSDANDGALLATDGLETQAAADGGGFRSLLELSLEKDVEAGSLLPVPGRGLPVALQALPEGVAVQSAASDPSFEISAIPVEWPSGLAPSLSGVAASGPDMAESEAGAVVGTTTQLATLAPQPLARDGQGVRQPRETGVPGRESIPGVETTAMERPAVPRVADRPFPPSVSVPATGVDDPAGEYALPASIARQPAVTDAAGERAVPTADTAAEALRGSALSEAVDSLRKESVTSRAASAAVADTGAAVGQATANTATSRTAAQSLPAIAVPVADGAWAESLSDRVLMMTSNKIGNAEIRLTPAELGPLRIQVSVDDSTVTVAFQATNPAARDAIEQALPRLREMLADSGLSLGQASVGDQGVAREGADHGADAEAPHTLDGDGGGMAPDESGVTATLRRAHDGSVDTFA